MHHDQLPPALQTVIARVVKAERRRANKQSENARREVFASLGEVLMKSLPSLFSKAAQHAPAGGVTVQGKEYVGGQFIPAEVMAEATPEERAAVEGKTTGKPADADPDRKAITDRLDGFGSVEDLDAEHDDLHEELRQRMLAADDDDEADRLADLIAFADEELERLKQEMADSDVEVVEDDDTDDTARDELASGDWHPVHADDWLSEDDWQHENPAEAAWDFRKSQAANRARFEKQLTAQAAADAAQVADFAAQAEARVKDLTGDETEAATIREYAKDAKAAIDDATAGYTAAAADYYDADKEAYKAEQKVPDGAMSTADIDALESAADRYREMRLRAAEKLPPADRDAEVERVERQHENRLSGVDRRAAKLKDKADQLAAVRDQQAARYESARSAYATTIREQVAAIQSAVSDIASGFTGRTAKSISRVAKSLGLSLQLEDLKEGVRRGHAPDVWAWNDLLASVQDELGLERVTKADRSHLVRKVIRNRLGRRQVVWVKPQEGDKGDRGGAVGEDGKPVEKPAPVAKTREQLAESRSVLAAAVNNPDRLNPEQVRKLADHIDSITKEEAKGLLKQLGAKVSGDQMAVAGRLLEAIRAGRGAGGVGEALKRAGNKTSGQYGAWGQAAGGSEKPVSRDTLPKRGVGPGENIPKIEAVSNAAENDVEEIATPTADDQKPSSASAAGRGTAAGDTQAHTKHVAAGIRRAIKDRPSRVSHGNTGNNAFMVYDDGEVLAWDHPERRSKPGGHMVHSHSGDTESPDNDSTSPHHNGDDIAILQQGLKNGDKKASTVIMKDGRAETIRVSPTATPAQKTAFASLTKKQINKGVDPSYDEAKKAWQERKAKSVDVMREKLEAFAAKYGLEVVRHNWQDEGEPSQADQPTPTISPAEFDRRMESIDPRDSGRVEVPEPVRPSEPDDADRERYDAARERLDRMRGWQADKPNDLRAEEQVRRAEGRLREVVGEEGEMRREPAARAVPPAPQTDHRARAATHRQTAAELEATARDAAQQGDREAARLNAVAARASHEAAATHDEVATVKRLQEREREQLAADQERRRKEAEAKIGDTAGRLEEARAKEEAAKKRVEELKAKNADSPKVEYVRAPAGGAVSEVDGRRYRGGQLMPVHGKYSGMERAPKGDGVGTGDEVQANPDSETEAAARRRQPAEPLSPEEAAERRAELEREEKVRNIQSGPLGKMMRHSRNKGVDTDRGIGFKNWQDFAEQAGESKMKKIVESLPPPTDPAEREEYDYQLEHPQDFKRSQSKKHAREFPSSADARHAVQNALRNAKTAEDVHRIHELLSSLTTSSGA